MPYHFQHRAAQTALDQTHSIQFYGPASPDALHAPLSLLIQPDAASSVAALRPVYVKGAPQALSGAGAANITAYQTNLTSTGAGDAITLADGTYIGQVKQITHVVDGGSSVLTPANFSNGTTITFTTLGEQAELIWDGANWFALTLTNVGPTALTLPAIA